MLAASDQSVVRGACHHDCPDTCAWEVIVVGGTAVKLRGVEDHPVTRGQLCPKVNRFIDRVYHPDRLLTPLRRNGPKGSESFEPISWEEAIALAAGRLRAVAEATGPEAILQYSFDGTQGVVQKGVMADRFFDAVGASDVRRHLCGVSAWLGAADVSGIPFGVDPEDLAESRTIILWGTNTLLTNRHLWPSIERAKRGGATLIVIDPVRTQTAAAAEVDRFLQIKPGSDVALVLAMIGHLDSSGRIDREYLARRTAGWAELLAAAAGMDPAAAAVTTGIPEATIRWLADTYATNRPASIRVLVGPEHREHGRDIMRAIAMLPAATGAWSDRGGGLARSTQVYFETALNYPRNRPPRRTFNMAALGDLLNDPGLSPAINALVVHNSNPAVINPGQEAVMTGLARDDLFTVVLEQFMTDTARYADLILPVTTQLEHLDLLVAWGHMYLSLNRPAIRPCGEALPNTEIFRRLAAAMNLDDAGLRDSDEEMVRQLLDSDHPWLAGISYERLLRDGYVRLSVPDGHRPNVDDRPQTEDGLLHLGPLEYRPGAETVAGSPALAAEYPLTLMSRKQHVRFLNANYGGFDNHHPPAGEPQLEIHRDDAAARNIESGDLVRVHNDRGELTVTAVISEDVQPGLTTIPFGWWHRATREGRGVNVLTNPATASDGTGSAFFHENLVEVERLVHPS